MSHSLTREDIARAAASVPTQIAPLSADYAGRSSMDSEDSISVATRGASLHLPHINSFEMSTVTSVASTSMSQGDVPSSLFYNYPVCNGNPPGRWAHSSCAYGMHMIVFGGIGHSTYDDVWILDTETMLWRCISPRPYSTPKDRPDKTMAHAAASCGQSIFVFGGQQGRNFIRKLYVLNVDDDTFLWRRISNDTLPSARAGHAMVTVDSRIFLFGGQGKKLMNDLHCLDPSSGQFHEVHPKGRLPLPRRGMSVVYDGMDSLVCFGGMHGSSIDNALSVYSLQRNEWSYPQQQGQGPSARTNHSAVLIAPGQMLVFGGCNAQGTFFNDAFILDTITFTWQRPKQLNTAPAPRYHHSCCHIKGRTYLYGGISAKQTFDSVVILDTKFAADISYIADELQSLTACSETGDTDASSVSSRVNSASASSDMMRLQLQDLLYKRNLEEMQIHALRRVEAAGEEVDGLKREEAKARVLQAEAEAEAASAASRAKEAEMKAAKDAAALMELRSSYEAVMAKLAVREEEAVKAKQQHEGLVKELGVISSRYIQLQQKCVRLSKASSQGSRSFAKRLSNLDKQHASSPSDVKAIESSPHVSLERTSADSYSSAEAPRSFPEATKLIPEEPSSHILLSASESACSSSSARPSEIAPSQPMLDPANASQHNKGMNDYNGITATVTHQGVRVTAAATEAPSSVNTADNALPGPLGVHNTTSSGSSPSCLSTILASVVTQRDWLQAEASRLSSCLEASRAEVKKLEGRYKQESLQQLSLSQLQGLESELETALKDVREAAVLRRIADAAQSAMVSVPHTPDSSVVSTPQCSICMERPRSLVFSCGHQCCFKCGEPLLTCPFCRMAITTKIKMFDT
ncbi:hypothetical protein CEUSTIGMA_g2002.t1 [Chlamydomonas eustigma]|uniref:RING-type domain-containing protein n=1 Tax=Chlamydomonas eustigma TaxID=1157962 RepID=A0A250WVA8_9CHLO|nr:hypothetical protein CEUSTIGMA_g2002.t1 [Chlamydomonas eustigma]|eukprot:GAX74552.1 hypothetical protein CEUSTIGMA_g2002.t1 [Chlamydomonas eustigma]